MSDESPKTPLENRGAQRPSTATVVVALLIVIAAGVGIGYAVMRDDGRDTPAEATGTPQPSGMTTGPSQPGQTAPGTRPTAPVAEGSALATISTPPDSTLAMIDADKLGADASYTITFSPFGYGPPQGGKTVVIRIATAEADNASAQAMDLSGRNMLTLLGQDAEVAAGGTYTGTLTFRAQGDLLLPVIGSISAQ